MKYPLYVSNEQTEALINICTYADHSVPFLFTKVLNGHSRDNADISSTIYNEHIPSLLQAKGLVQRSDLMSVRSNTLGEVSKQLPMVEA